MISKETFCTALRLIQEQAEINERVGQALELVGDGFYAFGGNNKYYDALMLVLKEAVHDQYDYISWWLYEATEEYEVTCPKEGKKWCLKELGDLYDFIQNECQ